MKNEKKIKNIPSHECHISNVILGKDFDLGTFGSF
jgi:hypothetical protein